MNIISERESDSVYTRKINENFSFLLKTLAEKGPKQATSEVVNSATKRAIDSAIREHSHPSEDAELIRAGTKTGSFYIPENVSGESTISFDAELSLPYMIQFFNTTETGDYSVLKNIAVTNYSSSGFVASWNPSPEAQNISWIATNGADSNGVIDTNKVVSGIFDSSEYPSKTFSVSLPVDLSIPYMVQFICEGAPTDESVIQNMFVSNYSVSGFDISWSVEPSSPEITYIVIGNPVVAEEDRIPSTTYGTFTITENTAGSETISFLGSIPTPYVVDFDIDTDPDCSQHFFPVSNKTTSGFDVSWNAPSSTKLVKWIITR